MRLLWCGGSGRRRVGIPAGRAAPDDLHRDVLRDEPRHRGPRHAQAGERGHGHVGDPATGQPFGDTASNLKSAVHGETHEYTDMYPGMAKTARAEGFAEIADWFETLAQAEKSHAGRFSNLLQSIS